MITRRDFLIDGLSVSAALSLLPAGATAAGCVPGRRRPRTLVVLQLTGGNDGLAMLVPHRQDAYWRARPTLALPRGELVALDDDHALHPSMRPLKAHFDEGRLACVHSVGYPHPDRSHFRSMEVWHTAEPDAPAGGIGWLGRLADTLAERDPGAMVALGVGTGELPLILRGEHVLPPHLENERGLVLAEEARALARWRDALCRPGETTAGGAGQDGVGLSLSDDLAFLRDAARASYRAAERMRELSARPDGAHYPDTALGRRLRLVARLVEGDFGTRLFHVDLEGFDTHARQAGSHAALLEELAGALDAFQRDLASSGRDEDVLVLVFSEFGRRVRENASRGTDHGKAAPVFVLGSGVRGGLHGSPPDLETLDEGDVPFTTDFRRIYAALERDWLGAPVGTPGDPLAFLAG